MAYAPVLGQWKTPMPSNGWRQALPFDPRRKAPVPSLPIKIVKPKPPSVVPRPITPTPPSASNGWHRALAVKHHPPVQRFIRKYQTQGEEGDIYETAEYEVWEEQLDGLGNHLGFFKKIKKVVRKIVKPIEKIVAPVMRPIKKIIRKIPIIGKPLAKILRKPLLPAVIAASFLIPGVGTVAMSALTKAGGLLAKAGSAIWSGVTALAPTALTAMTSQQRSQTQADIEAGRIPSGEYPEEFIQAYQQTVQNQARLHPEYVSPPAYAPQTSAPPEEREEFPGRPVAAGIGGGLPGGAALWIVGGVSAAVFFLAPSPRRRG